MPITTQKKIPLTSAFHILKYIGPGLIVTVGFIDPGNWAANIAAGSRYGYQLLWMVTLSTGMLILLQHNAAHLGIATGRCLSESTHKHIHASLAWPILLSAVAASIATAFAEILGGAIALNMLFHLPLQIGAGIIATVVLLALFTNSYKKIERIIIGFVSLIGISFLIELLLAPFNATATLTGLITPAFPSGSMLVIMSVLGAVVMPHNLFLHSEVIQSRQWNLQNDQIIRRQLRYELLDTIFSMIVGWAINSAIIILAAATFFKHGIAVETLDQAAALLGPLLGNASQLIFALALLFAGLASSITAGMAGGSIFAGAFDRPYDIHNRPTVAGILITLIGALIAVFFVNNPLNALIISQMLLSVQLPITILTQIYLTSSKKVMGIYANTAFDKTILILISGIVISLNIMLLIDFIRSNLAR